MQKNIAQIRVHKRRLITHAEINVKNFKTQKMLMQNFLLQKKRVQK